MYVTVDIEWIEKENSRCCPTLLSAVRTDNSGECVESFFEFIAPQEAERRSRAAAAGENCFIRAQSMRDAFSDFLSWIADEDILLFRCSKSQEVYNRLIFGIFGRKDTHKALCLKSRVPGSLVS